MWEAGTEMEKMGLINTEDVQIQGLLDRYLHLKVSNNHSSKEEEHLDEDSVAAFVEGNLQRREAEPIITHLVNCSFCRHVTAELVRLDFALADEDAIQIVAEDRQPAKISEVLSGLLLRMFGTTDGAVFAHEEKEEVTENSEEEKN